MSTFWSLWIMFLVVLNLGISLFLFLWGMRVAIPTAADGTSGHAWAHGVLREGVRRLPLWWVVLSAGMFVCAFIYLALYPGFGSFGGLLGWTSVGEFEREVAANDAKLAPVMQSFQQRGIDEWAASDDAVAIGHRLFQDNCAACHGTAALGNPALGAPDLTDSDWMYGGDPEAILASILDGRRGVMPPWGPALGHDGVVDVAAYVRSLSGVEAPPEWIAAGKVRYETMCAACHGIGGQGTPALGAPNLSDDVWLYGGDLASVIKSIRDGRGGEMPAWRERLGEDQARAVAAWIHANAARESREERQR